ncbi:MAG: hypothetical protein GKS06_00435 [Acidobacteria bacterium]|nr:hypothetical protein [Acidobacteriota bacterium]
MRLDKNPTPEQQLELVRRHAPVLWLHPGEAFHPVRAERMLDHSVLYRKHGDGYRRVPNRPTTLAELAQVGNSKNCHLKMRELEMGELHVGGDFPSDWGPDALARHARTLYGRELTLGVPGPATQDGPHYYARVSGNVSIRRGQPDDPHLDYPTLDGHPSDGNYIRVEYHYFFVYNDSWNQHQGDWDSTVVLYLRKSDDGEINGDGYLMVHMHHERWACVLPTSNGSICSWVGRWQRGFDRRLGTAYVLDGHPYIFIARGAHGGYPTPGHTLFGFNPPIIGEVLFNADERRFGRVCIAPPDLSSAAIRANVQSAGVDDAALRIGRWSEPTLITSAPDWFDFKGLWGQPSSIEGWSGPAAGRLRSGTSRRDLKNTMAKGYAAGLILDPQWHGIQECSG